MSEKIFVLIGTKSNIKTKTIQSIFQKLIPNENFEFLSFDVPSQISSQPWGNEEIISGAISRAKNAKIRFFDEISHTNQYFPKKYYYVGIEAGLIPILQTHSGFFDI